ncbi:MAG: hypothetical protein JKY61_13065 [Planctomycetes bacterium]|nr:hypothetical protein [Planctomycetota bacterium]
MFGTVWFQAAHDLIKAVYRMRTALHSVRRPFMSAGEFPEGYNPLTDNQAVATQYAYVARLRAVDAASIELDTAAIEAEVIWGNKTQRLVEDLMLCRNKLILSIELHLRHLAEKTGKPEPEANQNTLYAINDLGKDTDQYSDNLSSAISALEAFSRPYLDLSP